MIDLAQHRRFFAEEIEAVAKLQTPALVEAPPPHRASGSCGRALDGAGRQRLHGRHRLADANHGRRRSAARLPQHRRGDRSVAPVVQRPAGHVDGVDRRARPRARRARAAHRLRPRLLHGDPGAGSRRIGSRGRVRGGRHPRVRGAPEPGVHAVGRRAARLRVAAAWRNVRRRSRQRRPHRSRRAAARAPRTGRPDRRPVDGTMARWAPTSAKGWCGC